MSLPTCPFTPDQSNYVTLKSQGAVIETQLDGGLPATRLDKSSAAHLVTVQWSLSTAEWATMDTFYNGTLALGSLPFSLPLAIDGGGLATFTCKFVKDSYGLTGTEGDTNIVGGQVWAY